MAKGLTFYLTLIIIIVILIFFALWAFWKLWFLRNPERQIPTGKNLVSPADGKVVKIIEFNSKNLSKMKIEKGLVGKIESYVNFTEEGYIVSIFMTPFDVHYNRIPLDGTVIEKSYEAGKFLAVNTFEKGLMNEKSEIIIENKDIGKVKVIQIAGFLARRIETYAKPGDKYKKGEIFGLINLGSQVTIIVPKNVTLAIKEGDRVTAGSSIIATYK